MLTPTILEDSDATVGTCLSIECFTQLVEPSVDESSTNTVIHLSTLFPRGVAHVTNELIIALCHDPRVRTTLFRTSAHVLRMVDVEFQQVIIESSLLVLCSHLRQNLMKRY